MGIQVAVLNGNNYIISEIINGLNTSRLFNLAETTAYLTQEINSYQTCQLVSDGVPNIAVSDNPGSIYFGNSIFGSTVPSIVFAAAKVNCGNSISSGASTATSTSGLQTTGNTSLASIDSKLPTIGQKTSVGSVPVVIASDNALTIGTLPLTAATTTLQSAGNASLTSIATNTPPLGQALSTASVPVVLPASQLTSLTPPTNTGYALDVSVNSLLKPASTLAALTTLGTITNALPGGTNTIGKVAIDQTANIVASTTMQNAAIAVGNGTILNVQGYVLAIISITGTMGAGTAINFEISTDDITFVSVVGHQIGVAGNLVSTTTNTGDFRFSVAGYKSLRARVSVFGTGSITAKGYVTTLPSHATTVNANIIAALPIGNNNIGNVGIVTLPTVELSRTQTDIHGQALGVSRLTQITAKFFQQSPSNFLNITASGGATATGATLGLAVFATSTATTASLLGQTPTTVMYATACEAWASQAAIFTTPTSATSFQRLGIYDAVNGYFFGFNGLTFGLTIRSNSVDTFIAKSSWNTDALVGAVGSKFTSGGVPVALVPTNINMYRTRYGWYGAVTARLEIYSPDGDWVLVHVVRTANTVPAVNVTNPDLPMTVEVSKTASDATDLRISCGGWAAGITAPSSGSPLSGQGSIAALNALVAVPTTGIAVISFSVTGTWAGTLSFQYSLDGLAWTADNALNNVTGAFPFTTNVNGAFTTSVGSYKFYRIIATAWTSGSASVVYNSSSSSTFIVSQSLITDGTSGVAVSVKPPSTNVIVADIAMSVALRPLITTQIGQINPAADTPIGANSRIRSILFTNTSGATVFLGVYNSPIALTSASVPASGYVIRVPAGATLDKGIADFSINGRFFAVQTRIGLSSTMATFTALTAPILALTSLNLEIN